VRINHRITGTHDDPFWQKIERIGLDYDRGVPHKICPGISVLNVTEDQREWPDVEAAIAASHSVTDTISNSFTSDELDSAEWLVMHALGHHGYPQPDDNFGYKEATYDLSDYCATCGIGATQKAPFRLRADPKAAHSQFLQLNWVFDQYFLRAEARDGIRSQGISGVEFLSPVIHKNGLPSQRVSQLVVTDTLESALDPSGLQTVTCREHNEEWLAYGLARANRLKDQVYCGRVKYHLVHRGPLRFVGDAFIGAPDVVRSHEWFGSGASAFNLIVVNQKFHQLVVRSKWRGVYFEPLDLVKA